MARPCETCGSVENRHFTPQRGDILIRNTTAGGCELVDAVTDEHLDGPFEAALTAVAAARLRGARAIWQQHVEDRGRPLGDPFRLPDR